jgi:hypothetical protein
LFRAGRKELFVVAKPDPKSPDRFGEGMLVKAKRQPLKGRRICASHPENGVGNGTESFADVEPFDNRSDARKPSRPRM